MENVGARRCRRLCEREACRMSGSELENSHCNGHGCHGRAGYGDGQVTVDLSQLMLWYPLWYPL